MTDWPVKTLGEVCEVLDSLRKPITKRDRTSGVYPYYGATGIVDHVGDYIFDERLVLVGEDGAKWDAGDRTAFIVEGKYWVNNHAHVLRCKTGVLVDSWLANYLTMSDLNKHVSGLTVPKLNQGSLVSILIPVPPLEEQKRIVALLDAATARVTELTACYEQARTHANNLFTSALRDALEGNPDWPVKTLGEVCEVIAGQSPEGKFYNQDGKGTPFYQGKKDFTDRFLGSPTTWTTEATKMARPGDILMSVRAPVGPVNLCPIEACIGRGLAAIRPSSKSDTDFIYYYLESIQSEIAGTEGAVFASINKSQIANLRCPVPPLEEQKRIVARLDSMKAKTSEMVAAYDAKLTAAKNLRQSILEAAFAGQL